MKQILNHKKTLIIGLIAAAVVLSCGVVYALELFPQPPAEPITDALSAADVCREHLLSDCTECGGLLRQRTAYICDQCTNWYCSTELQESCQYCGGSVREYDTASCPFCGTALTSFCSGVLVMDGYYGICLLPDHPESCHTVQTLCKDGFYCENCEWLRTGVLEEHHIERYYHSSCPDDCRNDNYCTLVKFLQIETDVQSRPDNPHDPAAAGDYCETHDKFACDLDHFE